MAKKKLKEPKVAQCRYCTNSSNEGTGIWLNPHLWICMPCYEAFRDIRRD